MNKIMFNDAYGLTDAVLHGRKRQTRRISFKETYGDLTIEQNPLRLDEHRYGVNSHSIRSYFPKYNIGDVLAIAQPYKDVLDYLPEGYRRKSDGWIADFISTSAGLNNKMFVRSDLMPHHIKVIGVCCERLQDISDEDCLKEGIYRLDSANGNGGVAYSFVGASEEKNIGLYSSPREAFIPLIDKVSGKGTWECNPFVWVYDFELID